VKRGPKPRIPQTELQLWYEEEALPKGITVAEFEVYYFMPKYSIYPEAETATEWGQKGCFMYRNATEEERRRAEQ
jgi:hypothetical protein